MLINVIGNARSLRKENNAALDELDYVLMVDNVKRRDFFALFQEDISMFVKAKSFDITPFEADIKVPTTTPISQQFRGFLLES